MIEPYLTRLTVRLVEAMERVPAETRDRHAAFIRSLQRPDGGFPGREGGSDLYYTGFALRSLAVSQSLTPEVCEPAAAFLRERLQQPAGVIDFFSFLMSCYLVPLGGGPDVLASAPADWKDRVGATLDTFRTSDGGFGKTPGAHAGSTYTSFLVALCLQLLDQQIPEAERLASFVLSRRRPDGGFVEIAPMKRSGTNPTAAGVGVLQICNALTDELRTSVADFLAALPSSEGGYRANDRIPVADLLSTFTATWTLADLGFLDRVNRSLVRGYAESCEQSNGGFRGGIWDEAADVEYTFYGLGTLALTTD